MLRPVRAVSYTHLKSLGETFGLESQIVHGVFQLFGRLVLAAVLQAFRNITELCGPCLLYTSDAFVA